MLPPHLDLAFTPMRRSSRTPRSTSRAILLLALVLGACRAAPCPAPLFELEIDPSASFASPEGLVLVFVGARGALEVETAGSEPPRVPDVPAEPRTVSLQIIACRFFLGDHRGRLQPPTGPPMLTPPPRSVPFRAPSPELAALIHDGVREPDAWIEVGFPAFEADGLRIAGVAPLRMPIRVARP